MPTAARPRLGIREVEEATGLRYLGGPRRQYLDPATGSVVSRGAALDRAAQALTGGAVCRYDDWYPNYSSRTLRTKFRGHKKIFVTGSDLVTMWQAAQQAMRRYRHYPIAIHLVGQPVAGYEPSGREEFSLRRRGVDIRGASVVAAGNRRLGEDWLDASWDEAILGASERLAEVDGLIIDIALDERVERE